MRPQLPKNFARKLFVRREADEADSLYTDYSYSGGYRWVFILPVEAVATILVLELALLLYIKHDKMTMAAIGGLAVFTGMMILLQLLFGSPLDVSLIGGLRMLVMTMAFLCLLAASRIQDIAKLW